MNYYHIKLTTVQYSQLLKEIKSTDLFDYLQETVVITEKDYDEEE